MPTLYLSINAFDAEIIIEDSEPGTEKMHTYNNITSADGAAEAERFGFNPISSVTFREGTDQEEIKKAIIELRRHRVFTTLVSGSGNDETIEKCYPQNQDKELLELREYLVRAALMRRLSIRSGLKLPDSDGFITPKSELGPAGYLLKLSNSPDLGKLLDMPSEDSDR